MHYNLLAGGIAWFVVARRSDLRALRKGDHAATQLTNIY
jgi:hypothetical protein